MKAMQNKYSLFISDFHNAVIDSGLLFVKNGLHYMIIPIVLGIVFCSCSAYAVPGIISYQGILNDADGAPATGSKTITFSMYTTATGGTALWSESHTVDLADGVFNVLLGSSQAFPEALFQNEELHLGVKVGMDAEMTPRQRITSSAFANVAERANAVRQTGSVFTRWGTDTCPEGTSLIYSGYAYGGFSGYTGGATPFVLGEAQSLPQNTASHSPVYPIILSTDNPVPDYYPISDMLGSSYLKAAVCSAESVTATIFGESEVPTEWTTLYSGHLFAPHHSSNKSWMPLCIDTNNFQMTKKSNNEWAEILYIVTVDSPVEGSGHLRGISLQCKVVEKN